jgi:alkaline phosphatase D
VYYRAVSPTRRQFIWASAASLVGVSSRALLAQSGTAGLFRHGVASGDPLADRVILWTRVTPADMRGAVDVDWRIAADPMLSQVVARGTARTTADRDFTVKVDAGGLAPGRPYY